MPVQSIDLSGVTDATFDGSAVEQINLNGVEIWAGGPELMFVQDANNTFWMRPHSSFGNITGWPGHPAVIKDPANDNLHLGFTKNLESATYKWLSPVGTSKYFVDGAWDHMTVCRFNLNGSIADYGSIAWVNLSSGNPAYNIPPQIQGKYISMDSTGTLTVGACYVNNILDINYWTTVAQVLSACQDQGANGTLGTFPRTTTDIGFTWTVTGGNDFVQSHNNRTPKQGFIWNDYQ